MAGSNSNQYAHHTHQEPGWATPIELARIAAVLATFGFAALPVTYAAARLFTVPTAGYTLLTIVYIVTGLLFATAVTALQQFGFEASASALRWTFQLLPHFSLSECLRNMQVHAQRAQVCAIRCERLPVCTEQVMCALWHQCCEEPLFGWQQWGIAAPLAYMVAVGVLAIAANLLIEFRAFESVVFLCRRGGGGGGVPVPADDGAELDGDVLDERERVRVMSSFEMRSQSLVVRDVSKVYGQFCAVNRLSLAVDG